jgi:hypothetical protein
MHEHMIADLTTCEERSLIKGKATAIIATCQSSIDLFMWSIFSLLLRCDNHGLEHIIVSINGPDKRTGDPELQDKKQAFLEELRDLSWCGGVMPLTIQRTWSRVGHGQSIETAIPWVHTEHYILMHDDTLLENIKLSMQLSKFDANPKLAILYTPPLIMCPLHHSLVGEDWQLGFPSLNSVFLICRKSAVVGVGARWYGYTFDYDYDISRLEDVYGFLKYYVKSKQIVKYPQLEEPYKRISMDVGAWVNYLLRQAGYEYEALPSNVVRHIVSGSWGSKEQILNKLREFKPSILRLEKEIENHPEYAALYYRFKGVSLDEVGS